MTINERAEKAADFKTSGACNCCQAVTKVFADTVNVDEATLQKMSAGFAAGMGCMEATCGALVGANMILGLRTNARELSVRAASFLQTSVRSAGRSHARI